MADGISILRSSVAGHVAREVGLRSDQPTVTAGNQKTARAQGDIYALPSDSVDWFPLQVLDVGSPNFAKFYFLNGYDVPGDPSKVVR